MLADAASDLGHSIDQATLDATANVLAAVNNNIVTVVANGGAVDRNLAATKAVLLTNVTSAIDDLADGELSAADIGNTFSGNAIADLAGEVELSPTVGPVLDEIEAVVAAGGEQTLVELSVSDPDSRQRELQFTVTSSNGEVVDANEVEFILENGTWFMSFETGLLAEGETRLTVTVSDGSDSVSTVVALSLDGLNPVVQLEAEIAGQVLSTGESVAIDLGDHFDDPDGNATYRIESVGHNEVADVVITDGQLMITARNDLSGLAVFDLIARDDLGSVSTRFSVVTYPRVTVSDQVRYAADGSVVIDVSLSNPSTQTLNLAYDLSGNGSAEGALSGQLVFAPGETTKTLSIDLENSGLGDASVNQLAFDVNGSWTSGAFDVAINNRNPVELLDLRQRIVVTFTFVLVYDFVSDLLEEEGDAWVSRLGSAATEPPVVVESIAVVAVDGAAERGAVSDLVASTSLDAMETPRALAGI